MLTLSSFLPSGTNDITISFVTQEVKMIRPLLSQRGCDFRSTRPIVSHNSSLELTISVIFLQKMFNLVTIIMK